MNIFDLRLTTKQHLDSLESSIERKNNLCNSETKRADEAMGKLAGAEASLARVTRELNESVAQIRDLKTRLETVEVQNSTAQAGRVAHNRDLYNAGKILAAFKKAWKFRQDNPKMNPKQRQENNIQLSTLLEDLDQKLPRQISDPNAD